MPSKTALQFSGGFVHSFGAGESSQIATIALVYQKRNGSLREKKFRGAICFQVVAELGEFFIT